MNSNIVDTFFENIGNLVLSTTLNKMNSYIVDASLENPGKPGLQFDVDTIGSERKTLGGGLRRIQGGG